MSELSGRERARYVRAMFGRIAGRYDLLNRLMTFGQDVRWRVQAIRRLQLDPGASVLDLGSGTGDLAFEIARQYPESLVVASDFTPEMIAIGKRRQGGDSVSWLIADAQKLPFAQESFEAVISGFLLRNVPDVEPTLREQYRVLKVRGRVVALDTSPPQEGLLKPLLSFHLKRVIPALGALIAGDAEAYTYLPDSTAQFLSAEDLAEAFRAVGFRAVGFLRRMFGTVAIHWGERRAGQNMRS